MLTDKPSVFESIRLSEYRYTLPEERIAKHPLAERDQSKLLVYKNKEIAHKRFFELPQLLPQNSLLVFNNTRVIPARLLFHKETGAVIELFLLQPVAPTADIQLAMGTTGFAVWQCMIGNRKRWKGSHALLMKLNIGGQEVMVEALQDETDGNTVTFKWNPPSFTFAEIVEAAGEIPLPPYLKRRAEHADQERYQTVYSSQKGAVAAPTAGLHFTPELLQKLHQNGVQTEQLTLHVGAGTFQPIKESNLALHPMHREQLVITAANVQKLLHHNGPVTAVGTTSMRTLESLYWFGVKLLKNPEAPFLISKDEAYLQDEHELPLKNEALLAVYRKLLLQPNQQLSGATEIFIVPGYQFRLCEALITNFHQPESTLMLLVAAFVGADWKRIYQEALANNYRFLSYGDSSLLLPA